MLFRIFTVVYFNFNLTRRYARSLGAEVGDDTAIYPSVQFGSEPWLVSIGDGTRVTAGVEFITHDGSINILRTGAFGITPDDRMNRFGRIVVGKECFIGVHAKIMPNVTIGDRCIIGAASVVTKDVPAGTIVAGNPARPVGRTEEFADKALAESLDLPNSFPSEAERRRAVSEALDARRT